MITNQTKNLRQASHRLRMIKFKWLFLEKQKMKTRLTNFLKAGWRIQQTENLLLNITIKTHGKLEMMRMVTAQFLLHSRKLKFKHQWLTLPTARCTWVDPEPITWDQLLSHPVLHQELTLQKVTCGNLTMLKIEKDREKESFQPMLTTTGEWDTSIKISCRLKNLIGVKDHQLDQDLQLDKLCLLLHLMYSLHQTMSDMPQPLATMNNIESKENKENTSNTKRSNRSTKSNTRLLKYLRESGRRSFQLTELKSSHTSSARGTLPHSGPK